MHLDLTPLLPQDAIHTIEEVVAEHADDNPALLWPRWIDEVDVESTSVNILQASAQYLAAYGCLVSCLIFGTYCSRCFVKHRNKRSQSYIHLEKEWSVSGLFHSTRLMTR